MNGQKVTHKEIAKIMQLRKTGHSLPEITRIMRRGYSTAFRYTKNVKILPRYKSILREKQGGSKFRAAQKWREAEEKALSLVPAINKKEKLLVAACLYWGEGSKGDFSLSNTDPDLIRIFVACLQEIGIGKRELRVTIRIYDDLDKSRAISFWAKIIGIPKKQILNVNVLKGKKDGKLLYGMCRIRVTKGESYFKLLQSVIKVMKLRVSSRSSNG